MSFKTKRQSSRSALVSYSVSKKKKKKKKKKRGKATKSVRDFDSTVASLIDYPDWELTPVGSHDKKKEKNTNQIPLQYYYYCHWTFR